MTRNAKAPTAVERASRAIVQVGGGRGFVIETPRRRDRPAQRFLVTAAHCLPAIPPPHPMSYTEERTYSDLVAPLGGGGTIWAECMFADPIADLAVLCGPDGQELFEQALQYDALVENAAALRVAERPRSGRVWALALSGQWFDREMRDGFLIDSTAFVGGMSGSPILRDDGVAVGVVSVGSNGVACALEPWLYDHLPAWLVRRCSSSSRSSHPQRP